MVFAAKVAGSPATLNPGVATAWGLAYTSAAGPQTPSAGGNTFGAAAVLTSEKMKGADAVFGANNVDVVVPVTDLWAADGVFKGVSGGGAGAGGTADVVGGVSADAAPAGQDGGSGTSNGPTGNKIVPYGKTPTRNISNDEYGRVLREKYLAWVNASSPADREKAADDYIKTIIAVHGKLGDPSHRYSLSNFPLDSTSR